MEEIEAADRSGRMQVEGGSNGSFDRELPPNIFLSSMPR